MQYEKKVLELNGSLYVPLPIDLAKYLEWKEGDDIILQDETKKKGAFLAVWKK